ncbi:unnamed protein product [Diabrotica balteata]|uniref:Uncharacterized protein n=1 Tax=Diabrotica balteata TaxID=107213 RepID=A0A9N9SWB8_DIABA|nr:unnamed protein product [Diabrotica balteata]
MIKFIYEGEVNVYDKDLPAVLLLGEMFGVKGLSALKIKDQENSSNTHENKSVKYTILNASSRLTSIKEHRPPSLDDQINEPSQKKIRVESCEPVYMELSVIDLDDSNSK